MPPVCNADPDASGMTGRVLLTFSRHLCLQFLEACMGFKVKKFCRIDTCGPEHKAAE